LPKVLQRGERRFEEFEALEKVRQAFGKFCSPTGGGAGYRGSYPNDQTQNSDDEQYRAGHSRNAQSDEQTHRWLKQQRKHEGEDKRPDDIGRGVKSS
jgi:hypothetical protein